MPQYLKVVPNFLSISLSNLTLKKLLQFELTYSSVLFLCIMYSKHIQSSSLFSSFLNKHYYILKQVITFLLLTFFDKSILQFFHVFLHSKPFLGRFLEKLSHSNACMNLQLSMKFYEKRSF